jgi:hypothetical protein
MSNDGIPKKPHDLVRTIPFVASAAGPYGALATSISVDIVTNTAIASVRVDRAEQGVIIVLGTAESRGLGRPSSSS